MEVLSAFPPCIYTSFDAQPRLRLINDMSVSIENIAGSTEKPTTIRAKLQHLKISTMRRIGLPSTRQSRTIEAASTGASVATSAKGNKCDHWIIGIFGVKGVGKTALMDRVSVYNL